MAFEMQGYGYMILILFCIFHVKEIIGNKDTQAYLLPSP